MKYLVLGLALVFAMELMAAAPVCRMPTNVCKTYTTRVTAANFRSRVNCEGKSLRKLARQYGNICAVEKGKIKLYTPVNIAGKKYTIVDYMHKPSVNKHYRRAERRGITLDLCLDLYVPVPARHLRKYDLGITSVAIR